MNSLITDAAANPGLRPDADMSVSTWILIFVVAVAVVMVVWGLVKNRPAGTLGGVAVFVVGLLVAFVAALTSGVQTTEKYNAGLKTWVEQTYEVEVTDGFIMLGGEIEAVTADRTLLKLKIIALADGDLAVFDVDTGTEYNPGGNN